MQRTFLLLQLADSAFPAGGFAHSAGLEAAVQLGEVKASTLERHLLHNLEQAATSALPIATAAHVSPERVVELDHRYDAYLTNHVANRASRALGRAWLAAASAAFGLNSLRELRTKARQGGDFSGHYAPVFGAVSRFLDISRDDTQRLFLFLHLRGVISSAVRLSLVGPLEAQAMQHRFSGALESILSRCGDLSEPDVTTSTPLVDLFQGHHDRLYSRLFSS